MARSKQEIVIEVEKIVEGVVEEIVAPVKTTKTHYINNEEFLRKLLEYFEQCRTAKADGLPTPAIPNYIGECFYKIALNLSRKPNFMSYSYRDEMIMDGVENCLMYFRNFDPAKGSNPFSYFTQIIYFAFIRRIGKEKKQSYIKYKVAEQCGLIGFPFVDGDATHDSEDAPHGSQESLYDNIAEYIQTFEEKVEQKRRKRRKAQQKDLPDSND
jgi:hypothetical protein